MNKITKLFAVLLFASTFSVAANAQTSTKNFTGPSVEVGMFTQNQKLTDDGDPVSINGSTTLPRLAVNYGIELQKNLVLGLGATYTPGKSTTDYSDYDYGIRNQHSVYAAPTYLVSDATGIYAKLSYTRAKQDYEGDYATGISGFGYGVGIKTFLNKDIYLLAEYERVDFGTTDVNGDDLNTKVNNAIVSIGVKF